MASEKVMWGYVDWLEGAGFEPVSMVTFTFRDESIHPDRAWGLFKKWVKAMNVWVEGRNYRRKWKHSYFSYIVVPEFQSRGTIHYHMLVDNWLPWGHAIGCWHKWAGYIKIEPVRNPAASLRYVLKYLLKSSDEPVVWLLKNKKWNRRVIDINKVVDAYLDAPADFSVDKPGVSSIPPASGATRRCR